MVPALSLTVASETMIEVPKYWFALKPRHQVHGIMLHHRVIEPPPRADIAGQRFTRVQADPVRKLAALESLDLVQLLETRPAHERCADGIARVIGVMLPSASLSD